MSTHTHLRKMPERNPETAPFTKLESTQLKDNKLVIHTGEKEYLTIRIESDGKALHLEFNRAIKCEFAASNAMYVEIR